MPLPVWLPTWLTNLLGGGWIRNALGIRKDLIDTKKSKLEVKKLEDEERARNLITPATLDDVKKYDAKTRRLFNEIKRNRDPEFPLRPKLIQSSSSRYLRLWRRHRREIIVVIALVVILLMRALYLLLR